MPMDKKQPTSKVSGSAHAATSEKGSCDLVDFEVEFLHAATEADVKNTRSRIEAIPVEKLIKDTESELILIGEAEHYVNLDRNDKWLDPRSEPPAHCVTHVDRMTQHPRIVIRFIKPGRRDVEVELFDPTGNNLANSESEETRNPHFKHYFGPRVYTTDADGILIIDPTSPPRPATVAKKKPKGGATTPAVVEREFQISCTGGNKYKVKAKDLTTSEVRESQGTICTWRYAWLQKMYYPQLASVTKNADIAAGYADYFIRFNIDRHSDLFSDDLEIYNHTDKESYFNIARTLYESGTGAETEPHTVVLLQLRTVVRNLVDALEVKKRVFRLQSDVTIPSTMPIVCHQGFTDQSNWLVSATFTPTSSSSFGNNAASATPVEFDISAACSMTPYAHSICADTIKVTAANLPESVPKEAAGIITVSLRNAMGSVWNGLQFGGKSLCLVTMQLPHGFPGFLDRMLDGGGHEVLGTTVHEIGHCFFMVPSGFGYLPDRVATYTGSHCTDEAGCVMFNTGYAERPASFCSHCGEALRKMDLSRGQTRF